MSKTPLLITNDDGVNSAGMKELASELHRKGHPIIVLAPLREQSASGMKLTLREDMSFNEHNEIADEIRANDSVPLRVFSLDGSPCDCVIVSIDGGLKSKIPEISPELCISGINRGPNLSVDVLHSGTVSAAREASIYGMPSIAASLATYSHQNYSQSVDATISLIESICEVLEKPPRNIGRPNGTGTTLPDVLEMESVIRWFLDGNIFLNLNVPEKWNGKFKTVGLGARWYHNASDMLDDKESGIAFEVGAAKIWDEDIPKTDCNAVNDGFAAITPLETWPGNHPLGVPEGILNMAMKEGEGGKPSWIQDPSNL